MAGTKIPGGKHALVLTVVLLMEAGLFYGASRWEVLPTLRPLAQFPLEWRGWETVRETPVEQQVLDVLRADDTLSRVYVNRSTGATASLFLAAFKTQRTGQTPHSPKNCLPGSGFEPVVSGYRSVPIPGESRPVTINHYVVTRGEDTSVVLYWYQSRGRTIASEYEAKIWLVLDSIRYHRSDTAIVRVVVSAGSRQEYAAATRTGTEFVQKFYPLLRDYLAPLN